MFHRTIGAKQLKIIGKIKNNKEKVGEKKTQLIQLISNFKKEYDAVIEKLINKMAIKRDVPFVTGEKLIFGKRQLSMHWEPLISYLISPVNPMFLLRTFVSFSIRGHIKVKKIRDMFNYVYQDSCRMRTNQVKERKTNFKIEE